MTDTTTYIKLLNADGTSMFGGDVWVDKLPTQHPDGTWTPGEWVEVEGPLQRCRHGLHAQYMKDRYRMRHRFDSRHFEIEFYGEVLEYDDEVVGRRARLLREIPHEQWWIDTVAFVESIKSIQFFDNHGKLPDSVKLFDTRYAAVDAAVDVMWDAAGYAARDAARYAAWGAAVDVMWDAAGYAARDAAWDVARNTARYAAWDAAWDAAVDVMWDVMVVAQCLVAGFDDNNPHMQYARKRWAIWQAGYGVLCDVEGVLYVYRKL